MFLRTYLHTCTVRCGMFRSLQHGTTSVLEISKFKQVALISFMLLQGASVREANHGLLPRTNEYHRSKLQQRQNVMSLSSVEQQHTQDYTPSYFSFLEKFNGAHATVIPHRKYQNISTCRILVRVCSLEGAVHPTHRSALFSYFHPSPAMRSTPDANNAQTARSIFRKNRFKNRR